MNLNRVEFYPLQHLTCSEIFRVWQFYGKVEDETINGKKYHKWIPDEMVCRILNIIMSDATLNVFSSHI